MSSVKSSVLNVINQLPDDVTWKEALYHLGIRCLIEERELEAETAEFISHEEVFRELLGEDLNASHSLVAPRS